MTTERKISDKVTLKNGLVFPNRLVKAAMAEDMSKKTTTPTDAFPIAYKAWGQGGWGGIITGNVQVDPRFSGAPGDLTFANTSDKAVQAAWREYAAACRLSGAPAIVQVCHPGRQSPIGAGTKGLFEKNLAPSAVPLQLGTNPVVRIVQKLAFGTPKEMTVDEIEDVIQKFADAAKFVSEMGFDGIEIHAAHGYLLTLFLDPNVNRRTDSFGGSPENRVRIITRIIAAMRAVVPASFAIGIKLNSADMQPSRSTPGPASGSASSSPLDLALEQIALIDAACIDFLEISGGNYENPVMFLSAPQKSERTAKREAYFIDFARAVRTRFPHIILMLTGGFRTLAGMHGALADGACDLIGVARPAVADPAWAQKLLQAEKENNEQVELRLNPAPVPWLLKKLNVGAVGAGAESGYYSGQIARMGKGLPTKAP